MNIDLIWYWVSLNYATFGIACGADGVVKIAAPIARWMIGKDIAFCRNWIINNRKGRIVEIT